MQYLDQLTSQTILGFGGNFATKYTTTGNRQIHTEMFDYIRAGVNLCDTIWSQANFSNQFTPATSDRNGYVLPSQISA